MIVHRFMSEREYDALMFGNTLYNTTNHAKRRKGRSGSRGFCFFTEDPEEAVKYLKGIVDLDWCVTLDIPEHTLTKSWGLYAAPDADFSKPIDLTNLDSVKSVRKVEYCCFNYSLKAEGITLISVTSMYKDRYPSKQFVNAILKEAISSGRRFL